MPTLPASVMGPIRWLLAMLCLASLSAQAAIEVGTLPDELNLGPHVQLLEDAEREFDIEQLVARGDALAWQASRQETLNFSFSDSAWWVRLRIENQASTAVRRLLELAMPLHDYLDAYVVDEQGGIVSRWHSGDRRHFDSRPVAHRTFVLPVRVPVAASREVYLRLDTHDGLYDATPLSLMSDEGFLAKAQRELMAFSLYFGALLALLIYNLLLYVATRERSLLLYVAYLGSFFVLMFTARGFAFQHWWPAFPQFNNQLVPINIGLFAVTLAVFSNSFLNLREHAPGATRVILGVAGLCLLSSLPALLGHYAPVFRLMIPAAIVLSGLLLGVAAWRSWHHDTLARIYLVAWGVLLVGVALYFLRVAGVLPYNLVTEYAVQVGSGIEFLLLSLGLAWKINQFKNEKLAAERATLELQRSLNERLEIEVEQRTRELESANRRLTALARTDPLTGLLNRRQFHELVDEKLQVRRRSGQPLLFAVMDIDDFKLFNDTHGHQAGDEVLIQVSTLMLDHFRRAGDCLFRLGGEEFGILLEADSLSAGQHALERFRQALERLRIPHAGSSHGVVTGSFGLVYCSDCRRVPSAMALYRQADRAMYEAKERSRNRVVTRPMGGVENDA
ncbi:7TM diverse intracellular signaling domain-containing protein [Marinobacter sp. TBZ242]|uniref:diguanylate cyclase n=1 Tax=Marinobacter azerbaijanicus TaxID=3050455 RepID=A0ABT7ILR8_9GAMM|nr:7TM diverse intracellular signaling domain-containing protein [Marinobacter sp. TBZ242]MDL0434103.1 7TM diverse intracellular signaling domain-containing protein [Marinobacter sp. TBZ242]